jgi:hypothetical protein
VAWKTVPCPKTPIIIDNKVLNFLSKKQTLQQEHFNEDLEIRIHTLDELPRFLKKTRTQNYAVECIQFLQLSCMPIQCFPDLLSLKSLIYTSWGF